MAQTRTRPGDPRAPLRLVPPAAPRAVAAFFDLDRTLVPGSSLFPLVWEMRRRGCLTWRDVARLGFDQARYRAVGEGNAESLERVREVSLRAIRGWPRDWLLELARGVVQNALLPRAYPQGVLIAHAHRWSGREVYLVTSAPEDYALLLADALGMDGALGTRAEVAGGRFTGRLVGPINRGPEKARRIAALAANRGIDLDESFAYGDSISDLPMLELVGNPLAVNADRRLRAVARERGWQVLEFRRGILSLDFAAEVIQGLPFGAGAP
jgi:HAD superfamily hydrolase (TIGR01490 family)